MLKKCLALLFILVTSACSVVPPMAFATTPVVQLPTMYPGAMATPEPIVFVSPIPDPCATPKLLSVLDQHQGLVVLILQFNQADAEKLGIPPFQDVYSIFYNSNLSTITKDHEARSAVKFEAYGFPRGCLDETLWEKDHPMTEINYINMISLYSSVTTP